MIQPGVNFTLRLAKMVSVPNGFVKDTGTAKVVILWCSMQSTFSGDTAVRFVHFVVAVVYPCFFLGGTFCARCCKAEIFVTREERYLRERIM